MSSLYSGEDGEDGQGADLRDQITMLRGLHQDVGPYVALVWYKARRVLQT